MHRTTLGDFELTVVSDGTYFLDGGAFFGVVPKTMWSKKIMPDAQNRIDTGPVSYTHLVISKISPSPRAETEN